MNTIFKILWFEDELAWFIMEKLRVESVLAKHALKPQITRKTGEDFSLEEIKGNEYDLILMDFILADEATGDEIVSALRENSILTDILFYSSEEQRMLEAIRTKMPPIDGVYLTKRDYTVFTKKIEKLISKIVRRSEDIVNLRGFVMDGSCDFEVRIREILNIAWSKFTDAEKKDLEDATGKAIRGIEKRNEKTKEKVLENNPVFPAAINHKVFFTHSDRLSLLTKVIAILQSNYGLRREPALDSFRSHYEDHISCYRNALGHKKEADQQIEIKNGVFIPVDEELHRQMRINLQQYDALICELETFVTEKL